MWFICLIVHLCTVFLRVPHNVLALGEEADFEALNCLPALYLIRSTKLHLSSEPAFLPNAGYRFGILFGRLISFASQFSVNVQTYKFSVFNFTVSHCSFVLEVKFFHCVFTVQIVCFNKPFNSM